MPTTWIEPEVYYENEDGVKIWRTYFNQREDEPAMYIFTTEKTTDDAEAPSDYVFDIREVNAKMAGHHYGEAHVYDHAELLKAAIEHPEKSGLKFPQDNRPMTKAEMVQELSRWLKKHDLGDVINRTCAVLTQYQNRVVRSNNLEYMLEAMLQHGETYRSIVDYFDLKK